MNKDLGLLWVCLYNAVALVSCVGGSLYLIKDRNYWGFALLVFYMIINMSYSRGPTNQGSK